VSAKSAVMAILLALASTASADNLETQQPSSTASKAEGQGTSLRAFLLDVGGRLHKSFMALLNSKWVVRRTG
jgi:hypothetical protein